MGLKQNVVWGAVGAVLVGGSVSMATLVAPDALVCPVGGSQASTADSVNGRIGVRQDGMRHGSKDEPVMTGDTCNQVEMAAPGDSTYVPDIAGASAADRAKAQQLLDGVNDFCRTHSAADLESQWRPGLANPANATHFFNPDSKSWGLDPANPRAALVYNGELSGVMFTGSPLPSLGSIPRAHSHDTSRPAEMLHVYCTTNLKEAFTPNRRLGVNADLHGLRLRIRPAVMELDGGQLRALLARVRGYTGSAVQDVSPVPSSDGHPDPVLQAMRIEIRRSLSALTEPQLRSVWTMLRSY